MSNRHKRSKCSVCEKWMRSDNYDRHMKIHKDIFTLPDNEIEAELKARQVRKLEKEGREEKRQQIVETASKHLTYQYQRNYKITHSKNYINDYLKTKRFT